MVFAERRGDARQIYCPHCLSVGALRRSRTRWWERPLRSMSTKKPYRCGCCGRRAWLGAWRDRRMQTTQPAGHTK